MEGQLIAAALLLVIRLVNGPAVYEARGWRLSVPKTMAEERV